MPLRKKSRTVTREDQTMVNRSRTHPTLFPEWDFASYSQLVSVKWPELLVSNEDIEYDVLPGFSMLQKKREKMRLTKKTLFKYYQVYPFDLPTGNCVHRKLKTFESCSFPDADRLVPYVLANGALAPSPTSNCYSSYSETAKAIVYNDLVFAFLPGDKHWTNKRYSAQDYVNSCAPVSEEWCRRAFDGCCDIIQHQGNMGSSPELAQFLIELGQLRSTFRALRSPLRTLASLGESLTKKGLRSFFKTIAEQHLNLAFNVLPNISDITDAYTALAQFPETIRNIERNAGKDLVYHWRPPKAEIPVADWATSWDQVINREVTGFACRGQASEYMITGSPVNITIHYCYALPQDFSSAKTKFLLAMDALGIYSNPKIIWDEIPFSFVMDWFLKIGDWLEDNFASRNVEFPITINDCSISYKYEVLYSASGKVYGFNGDTLPVDASGWNRLALTNAGYQTNSVFVRRRWCPRPGWVALRAGQPGLNQILLGTSLITVNCL